MVSLYCTFPIILFHNEMALLFRNDSNVIFYFYSGALEDVRSETRARAGYYDVTASAILEEPEEPADFHCVLRIPDAQYEVRKSLVYYPGEYTILNY